MTHRRTGLLIQEAGTVAQRPSTRYGGILSRPERLISRTRQRGFILESNGLGPYTWQDANLRLLVPEIDLRVRQIIGKR